MKRSQANTLLTLLLLVWCQVCFGATIVAATTGNDTTGNGTSGTPYATVNKCISVAAAGDTINLNDGTFNQENNANSCLTITTQFAAPGITIVPTLGNSGAVTIQGLSSTSQEVVIGAATNITFQYLTFLGKSTNTGQVIRLTGGATPQSGITFDHCTIKVNDNASQVRLCVSNSTASPSISNLSFTNCTFNTVNAAQDADAIYLQRGASTTVDTVTITNCTFTMTRRSIRLEGVTNADIERNKCTQTSSAASHVFSLGYDAVPSSTTYPTNGTVTHNYFSGVGGHCCLIGAGVTSATVSDNVILGGGQGLVLKACNRVTAQRNIVSCTAALNAFYYKDNATNCVVTDNTFAASGSGNFCARLGVGDTGNTASSNVFTNNRLISLGSAQLQAFNQGATNGDGGGNIWDRNILDLRGSSTTPYGLVWNTSNIATLTAFRTAAAANPGLSGVVAQNDKLAGPVTAPPTSGASGTFTAWTPSDFDDVPYPPRAVYVGVAGDVEIVGQDGFPSLMKAVPVGRYLWSPRRILATGTTATNIVLEN